MKSVFAACAIMAALTLGSCNERTQAHLANHGPTRPISVIAGTYSGRDGAALITIKDTPLAQGWDGVMTFVPAAGDWATSLRCRIYKSNVQVEVPAKSGAFEMALFRLDSDFSMTGLALPWSGEFVRVAR